MQSDERCSAQSNWLNCAYGAGILSPELLLLAGSAVSTNESALLSGRALRESLSWFAGERAKQQRQRQRAGETVSPFRLDPPHWATLKP